MIKGIRTGTQIVQPQASDEILGGQPKTKTQFGIGGVSYSSEKIKQQLGPIEQGTTFIDELKKDMDADLAERTDVQQTQDMMGKASQRANLEQNVSSKMGNQIDRIRNPSHGGPRSGISFLVNSKTGVPTILYT